MATTHSSFFQTLDNLIRNSDTGERRSTAAEAVAELGTPSISIAILDQGRISSHCISSIGNNTETVFQACSISKTLAGLATMKLVELGYFSVDDKICDLLSAGVARILAGDREPDALLKSVTAR